MSDKQPKTDAERAAFWKEEALRAEAERDAAIKHNADLQERNAELESQINPATMSEEEYQRRFNENPESLGLPKHNDPIRPQPRAPEFRKPLTKDDVANLSDEELCKLGPKAFQAWSVK